MSYFSNTTFTDNYGNQLRYNSADGTMEYTYSSGRNRGGYDQYGNYDGRSNYDVYARYKQYYKTNAKYVFNYLQHFSFLMQK